MFKKRAWGCGGGSWEGGGGGGNKIRAKYGIPNWPQSPDIGQNSDGRISDFPISGQPFINENCCYNSRNSDDIDMKLGQVTKFDKRNTATSKKFDDDVMSANCNVIVFFRFMEMICSHSEAGFRTHGL